MLDVVSTVPRPGNKRSLELGAPALRLGIYTARHNAEEY
jgi:hypothetical protein